VVRKSSTGAPLRWSAGAMSVTVALDDAVPSGVDPAAARAAARGAVAAYQEALRALAPEVRVELIETTGPAPATAAHDGKNTIRWVRAGWDDDYDPAALAVTVTTYDGDSGRITDADVVVNAERYRWFAASDVRG